MKTVLIILALLLGSICYAAKVSKKDFEKISYYVKAQGTPTGTGFEYIMYDSEGYTHTITTTIDEKITVWSYYGGGTKSTRSSLTWEIYPRKIKTPIKEDEKKVDGFYTYINKTISSKIKVRR